MRIKSTLILLLLILMVTGVCFANTYLNPVLPDCADPAVLFYQGTYYLYPTNSPDTNNGFKVYTSNNLVNWTDRGWALAKANSWGTSRFWAPDVTYYNGLFYMYYCTDERICVATSSSPLGPFVQSVKQPIHLNTPEIDPHLFIDTDGQKYLYFVRFNNGNELYGAKLNADMKTINESTVTFISRASQSWEKSQAAPVANINEGPFMLKRNGIYYLTYSANHFQSPDYGVGYQTASSPLGPYTKYAGNPIMRSNTRVHGSAHHCVTTSPDGSEMFIVYHCHNSLTTTDPRKLCIDRISFTSSNTLQVVGPTTSAQTMPSGASGGSSVAYIRWESNNMTGYFMRHKDSRGRMDSNITPAEDSQWKMVAGLADANGVSFESVNFPGRYLRHRNGEIWLDTNDGSQLFKDDATFYKRAGLANSGAVSFESRNFPGRYIRHRDYLLYSEAVTDTIGKNDATFWQR